MGQHPTHVGAGEADLMFEEFVSRIIPSLGFAIRGFRVRSRSLYRHFLPKAALPGKFLSDNSRES
ncbi:MAG: hypothetical protein P8K71_06885 [Actinomycetota bacterium]|nr:hypothetical protein [Actinomycetota bacterium]